MCCPVPDNSMIDRTQLTTIFHSLKIPGFRIKQLMQGVKEGKSALAEITTLPRNVIDLLSDFRINSIKPVNHLVSGKGDTEKVLFEIDGGFKIESVLMKYRDGRHSVCISCQAGCQMGCRFCSTGAMKFGRNLTYEEIFDQVLYFYQKLQPTGEKITNIIFMGMGEPFMNYENVLRAARMFNDEDLLNIGARRITISTCGIADKINQFADEAEQFNLAISLHAPMQELREKIMPIAKRWKLEELLPAVQHYINKTGRRVSYEYVMLKNINDTTAMAEELAAISRSPFIHINIIPYNFTGLDGISGSDKKRILQFQSVLQKRGINATVRTTMGEDIKAACGQLASKN